jgi:hypothetical protein
MGRGARPTRRWKNDRIRTKKARLRRKSDVARAAAAERKGSSAGASS